jgi:transcriptional regulator with XRE-family HTH domain
MTCARSVKAENMKTTAKKTAETKTRKTRLKEVRQSRGLSQEALGKELGLSKAHVNRIENDVNQLTVERLLQICGVLNAGVDEIVDIPLRGKAKNKNCDQALLGTVIGTILETAQIMNITPSGEELSKWSSYVYNEVLAENLNFKQTKDLAAQIVKISTRLKS